jgi:protein-S-isoprenylcysteine O-methyltransferase Ste14
MGERDWRTITFEFRSIITMALVALTYSLSMLLPLHLYTVAGFLAGLTVLSLGIVIRAFSIGFGKPKTSGRGRKLKADGLNTTGPYAWVRNPLYLGNVFAALGLALMTGNISFSLFLALSLVILYRLVSLAEGAFLDRKFGEEYRLYKRLVPVFLPSPKSNPYKTLPWGVFNFNRVLRREHDTWYMLLLLATGISAYRGYLSLLFGMGLFILFTLGWAILKIEKRKPDWGVLEGSLSLLGEGHGLLYYNLLSYVVAFLMGLTVGSLLFVAKSDLFLTILEKWL